MKKNITVLYYLIIFFNHWQITTTIWTKNKGWVVILIILFPQWMGSKLEHLASGRYCPPSSAVPAPLTSRTERKIAPVSLLHSRVFTCPNCPWRWLLQALSHHVMDLCAGIGTFSVWSLHLQNCTSDYWRHGTAHSSEWVWKKLKAHWGICQHWLEENIWNMKQK